jgi:hypothetical protein
MDYLLFALFVLALVGVLFLIRKMDARDKNKYKKAAYGLLEASNPDPKEVKNTLRGLRLYGGRFRKDKEFMLLIKRLLDKYEGIIK